MVAIPGRKPKQSVKKIDFFLDKGLNETEIHNRTSMNLHLHSLRMNPLALGIAILSLALLPAFRADRLGT